MTYESQSMAAVQKMLIYQVISDNRYDEIHPGVS